MKISDLLEGSAGSGRPFEGKKKRPPKTLWFNMKELWGHDIRARYPSAELMVDGDENRYVAVDVEKNMCYGQWQANRNTGCSYDKPRPLQSVVKSRKIRHLTKYDPNEGSNL